MNLHHATGKVARDALRALLVACGIGVVAAGCALAGRGPEEEPLNLEITLHVRNQNFYDATLYAVPDGGSRTRLGVVRGFNEETFKFRWLHGEMRIVIDLLAAGATYTESMPVTGGDELELIITPDAHRRR